MASDFHPITNLKLIDIRRKETEIRGGFVVDQTMADFMGPNFTGTIRNATSPFITLDKATTTLDDLLTTISVQLKLPKGGSSEYGLMHEKKGSDAGPDKSYSFVTQDGLSDLKDGFLLLVTASPNNYAKTMLRRLENANFLLTDWQSTLEALFFLSQDAAFAEAFHSLNGIHILAGLIEQGHFDISLDAVCRVFSVFIELMRHSGLVEWSELTVGFITKVAGYVNGSVKLENNESLWLALSLTLSIFDKGGPYPESVVLKSVRFETLIRHLVKKEERILLCVLTLMNLIFEKSEDNERQFFLQLLHDRPFRSAIEDVIKLDAAIRDERIVAQLMRIQDACISPVKQLALRMPTTSEVEHVTDMPEWEFLSGSSPRSSMYSDVTDDNDTQSTRGMAPTTKTRFADLVTVIPPGSLAIDALLDFSKRFGPRLREMQSESSLIPDAWPLIMAHLANFLLDILGIVPQESEVEDHHHQKVHVKTRPWGILFHTERPFYDIFAIAIELFHRTWREMHANIDDEEKVLNVVRHQLALGLDAEPGTCKELDDYLQRKLTYFHIQKIWEKQRIDREENELRSDAVRELQKHLRPTIEDLVKTRKKNVLKQGAVFSKLSKAKSQATLWHWRLDDNERYLWYADCLPSTAYSSTPVPDFKTRQKIPITDIKKIITGTSYNEVLVKLGLKLTKKNLSSSLKNGFALDIANSSESMVLASEDAKLVQGWIEGFTLLTGAPLTVQDEVNRLLDLEVRVRLLDVPQAPTIPPQLPSLPLDFSWIPQVEGKRLTTVGNATS